MSADPKIRFTKIERFLPTSKLLRDIRLRCGALCLPTVNCDAGLRLPELRIINQGNVSGAITTCCSNLMGGH